MPSTTRPPLPPVRRAAKPIQRDQEMRWISRRQKDYPGEWVALEGDRLIAHSKDADAVYAAACAQTSAPFLFRCPDNDLPTVGGF